MLGIIFIINIINIERGTVFLIPFVFNFKIFVKRYRRLLNIVEIKSSCSKVSRVMIYNLHNFTDKFTKNKQYSRSRVIK